MKIIVVRIYKLGIVSCRLQQHPSSHFHTLKINLMNTLAPRISGMLLKKHLTVKAGLTGTGRQALEN